MNCLESQEILQRRLDGEPFVAYPALDQHLAQCSPCRERHTAARRLLESLRAAPRPELPESFTDRVVDAVLRDRLRRRTRLRRSLYVTAALAASILVMLLFAYWNRPGPGERRLDPGPVVQDKNGSHKEVPPIPRAQDHKKGPGGQDPQKKHTPASLAALTGRLADRTLDQAKVLWTAANPVEGVPVGELPKVPEFDPQGPAAQPIRQAQQEVSESLQAVTRSARRAFDYFSREMPMLDVPQSGEH
jgi:hypothetical protein